MRPIENQKSKIKNTARLAWHHFIFDVPNTWEVIAHKKNPEDGQLVISDRHGQTMLVFWKRMKHPPALKDRLAELVAANTASEAEPSEVRRCLVSVHGWDAVLARKNDQPGFAARYLDDTRILLTVIFPPHPKTETQRAVADVLHSFRANTGDDRSWAAFGLDFTMPAEMRLTEIEAQPAMQSMRFENKRGDAVTVRRYGMLSIILAEDDMAGFYARCKGPKIQLRRRSEFTKDRRYPGVELSYKTRGGRGLTSMLGRAREGRVWLWRCDDIQRLFCVDHCARRGHLRADLVERVRCQ